MLTDRDNLPTLLQAGAELRILKKYVQPIRRLLRAHVRHLTGKLYPLLTPPQQLQWLALSPALAINPKSFNQAAYIQIILAATHHFIDLPEKYTPQQQDNQRRAQQLCACYSLLLTLKEGNAALIGTPRSGYDLLQQLSLRLPESGFANCSPAQGIDAFRAAYLTMQPVLIANQDTLKGFFKSIFQSSAKVTLTNAINTKLGDYQSEFIQTAQRLLGRPR